MTATLLALDPEPIVASARVTILVCDTCRAGYDGDGERPGAQLAAAAEALAIPAVRVRRVACLANCKRGCSAAMRSVDGWTYLFGDLDAAADAPALIAGATLLSEAAGGLMPWRGRPDCLKRGLVGRLPPPALFEDLP